MEKGYFFYDRGSSKVREIPRYAQLRRLGVSHYHAGIAAGTGSGFWRMARHVTVQQALPNAFFDSIGLPRLEAPPTAYPDRTAVVRIRMPGGVGGEEPRGSPLSRSKAAYRTLTVPASGPLPSRPKAWCRSCRINGGASEEAFPTRLALRDV